MKLALNADRTSMPIESEIKVFEDRIVSGEWRVEYFDDDGGCYVAIFAGPWRRNSARGITAISLSGRLLTAPLRRKRDHVSLARLVGPRLPCPRRFSKSMRRKSDAQRPFAAMSGACRSRKSHPRGFARLGEISV